MRSDWLMALKVRLGLAYEFIGLGDSFSISVSCRDGHVTLTGRVRNEYRQCRAEEVAWRVRGVSKVTNKLSVREGPRVKQKAHAAMTIWPVSPFAQVPVEEFTEEERATEKAVLQALHERGVPTGPSGVRPRILERTAYLLGTIPDGKTAEMTSEVVLALPQVDRVRSRLRVGDGRANMRPFSGAAGPQRQTDS